MGKTVRKKSIEITDLHKDIYQAKICPYCHSVPEKVSGDVIYHNCSTRIAEKFFYLCRKCGAYSGTHKDGRPLGSLANEQLRKIRIEAHSAFDFIHQSGAMGRKASYSWLSKELNIPIEYTHIGMFSMETCKKVIQLSRTLIFQLNLKNGL